MRILSLAAAFCMTCVPAMAAQVTFSPLDLASPEADVAGSVVELTEGVQSSLVDLDGDGKGEILLRFPSDCTEGEPASCRVAVLQFSLDQWKSVFDRKVNVLETGDAGYAGVLNLVSDQLHWKWDSTQRYLIDTAASGTPVVLAEAPSDYVELLAYQFGEGALNLLRKLNETEVRIGTANLAGTETSQIVARLQGPGVCGRVMGCPVRVLSVVDGEYVTLLEGSGIGEITVLPVNRAGWSDVITNLPDGGFSVYGWDGERYGVIEVIPGETP